jgi:hypothetical protein
VRKTPFPLNENNPFTKTGSGQTWGKHSKKRCVLRRRSTLCMRCWSARSASGARNASFAMPFHTKNNHFTKTGSSQTIGKALKSKRDAFSCRNEQILSLFGVSDRLPEPQRPAASTPYDFLVSLGTEEVSHANVGSNFLDHLSVTSALLASWGCDKHTVNAGLFHSVYGTAAFDLFSVPMGAVQRERIRGIIGAEAERVVFINCAMVWKLPPLRRQPLSRACLGKSSVLNLKTQTKTLLFSTGTRLSGCPSYQRLTQRYCSPSFSRWRRGAGEGGGGWPRWFRLAV